MKKFVYHGSKTPDIEELEPRQRFTPGLLRGREVPLIYAASDPAYAAGHGFEWTSEEGFDIGEKNGEIVLKVPQRHLERLNTPIHIYTLPADNFRILEENSPKASILVSDKRVRPIKVDSFRNVREAIEHYKGRVRII
jgi:hypothetical protein